MKERTNEDLHSMDELLGKQLDIASGGYILLRSASGSDEELADEIGQAYRSKVAHGDSLEVAMLDLREHQRVPQFGQARFEILVRLTAGDVLEWFDRLQTVLISTNRAFRSIERDRYIFRSLQQGEIETEFTRSEGEERAKAFIRNYQEFRSKNGPLDIILASGKSEGQEMIDKFLVQNKLTCDDWIVFQWEGNLQSIVEFFEPPNAVERISPLQEYRAKMMEISSSWLPRTWSAFFEICISTKRINNMELEAIKEILTRKKSNLKDAEKNAGELDKLRSILRPN